MIADSHEMPGLVFSENKNKIKSSVLILISALRVRSVATDGIASKIDSD